MPLPCDKIVERGKKNKRINSHNNNPIEYQLKYLSSRYLFNKSDLLKVKY